MSGSDDGANNGCVGVCSWSLRAGSARELIGLVRETGAEAVQLALEPIRSGAWDEDETFGLLSEAGVRVLSGMMETVGEDYSSIDAIMRTGGVRPDAVWEQNLAIAGELAELASRRGIGLVTFHAGYLPHDDTGGERSKLLDRVGAVSASFARAGVVLGLETGQESAQTLLGVLDELDDPNVGVNFDPANMLLYGTGDPIEALRDLSPRVVQVHIKDAVPSGVPGEWGSEVRVGTGHVDWPSFFGVVRGLGGVDLVIEREAGEQRVADIAAAYELIRGAEGLN